MLAATTSTSRYCSGRQRAFQAVPCAARRVYRRAAVCVASAQADGLLLEAKTRYERGDRLTAMKLFEDALKQASTTQQRQAALFGCTAVHASFGDAELAQMTLRDAVREGLDFDMAVADLELVQINSSPQIMIQLRNFAKKVRQAAVDGPSRPAGGGRPVSLPPSSSPGGRSDISLENIIGAGSPEEEPLDASPLGIAKRVALVVAVLVGFGVVLFYLGLEYGFK